MRADNNGEGGIMALLGLSLRNKTISNTQSAIFSEYRFIWCSTLFGDGIITPAISVLSAIEGLKLVTPVLILMLFQLRLAY